MTNEEQKEKIFYLQFSEKFEREEQIKALKLGEGMTGRIMHSYYLDMLAAGLKNGGVLTMHGKQYGYETPAHEMASLIDSTRPEDIAMIAVTMKKCQDLGLIRITDDAGPLQINFALVYQYTRKISKGTEYKNELADKKRSETPAIEDKGGEPEKKPSNRAKAQAEADAMFERLWRRYPKKKLKGRVKPAAKYRLYKEYGEEKCQRVVDMYAAEREGKDPTYTYYGCNFFNKEIFEYLDGDAGQPAGQPAQPKAQPVTEKTVRDTIMREGIWNIRTQAWDRAKLDEIRDKIGPEMAAAIEAKMS